jgi:hypothetical protein
MVPTSWQRRNSISRSIEAGLPPAILEPVLLRIAPFLIAASLLAGLLLNARALRDRSPL